MSFDSYEGDQEQELAHERRIVRCHGCNAKIIWFKTEAGKNMCVDADTVEPQDVELDLRTAARPQGKHIAHWASCPSANQFRRPR